MVSGEQVVGEQKRAMQEAFDALVKFQMLNQFDRFMGFLDPKAEDPEIKLKKYLTSWCQKNEYD